MSTTKKKQPKTLTDKQIEQLKRIGENINDVRWALQILSENDEMTMGHVMFKVGSAYEKLVKCSDEMDEIIDLFDESEEWMD